VSEAKRKEGIMPKCFKIEKNGTIKRGCAEDAGEKYCIDEKAKDSKIDNCFACEKDYCNDNSTVPIPIPTNMTKSSKNETSSNGKGGAGIVSFDCGNLLVVFAVFRISHEIFN
jgi:hypothetical protein